MPYIKKEDRLRYSQAVDRLIDLLDQQPIGDFNYVISRIVWAAFDKNKSYTFGNSLMGMLICVAQEFYRRKLSKYEDLKIKENGDI